MAVIGVVGALKQEIKPLIEAMDDAEASKWGKRSVYKGMIGARQVVVASCGVGKVKAAACTQHLIDRFSVEAVICTGAAGAINPRLGIGDIVISEKVLQHDFVLGEPALLKKFRKRWSQGGWAPGEAGGRGGEGSGLR